ncbi:MAG: 30S ribosomal protein S20 [Candidatus Pacebacteria bacterium]|nr:30S ribosomal protein S20 [Candidatus Paceibacterota bacterium]
MPIIKAQKKSVRQTAKRRIFNDRRRRAMRESIKSLKELVATGNKKEAQAMIPTVYQAIDKAVKRGVIKFNTGSRKKSQASKIVKEIA